MSCRPLTWALWTLAAASAALGCGESASEADPVWPALALLQEEGFEQTYTTAFSADGAAVAVVAYPFRFDGVDTTEVQVWRADGVRRLDIPGGAGLISGDGSILLGTRYLSMSRDRHGVFPADVEPFRWSTDGGTFPDAFRGFSAVDMTPDGGTFVGTRTASPDGTRVLSVRTLSGAGHDLEQPAEIDGLQTAGWRAPAISPDGDFVAGNTWVILVEPPRTGVSELRALRWDGRAAQPLPGPAGLVACLAADVSRGGRVTVGSCTESFADDGVRRQRAVAVVWEDGQPRRLPNLDRFGSMRAEFVSDDGLVVAGRWFSGEGTDVFVWSELTGVSPLQDLLPPDAPRLAFERLDGLSAAGHAVAGTAYDEEHRSYAFRAALPLR